MSGLVSGTVVVARGEHVSSRTRLVGKLIRHARDVTRGGQLFAANSRAS
jgi:hypothetical protein